MPPVTKVETPAPAEPVKPVVLVETVPNNRRDHEEYVRIPPGTFKMGCVPRDSKCKADEKPQHEVTLTNGFWMGRNEVNARDANELAFAVGAVSHYLGDSIGHSQATNQAVALQFPKLAARYGPSVNYAEAGTSMCKWNLHSISIRLRSTALRRWAICATSGSGSRRTSLHWRSSRRTE